MSTFNSTTLLTDLETEVNKTIARTGVLEGIPANFLTGKPAENKWSILQVLYHLETYNDYYLPLLEKALNRSSGRQKTANFRSGWLGDYFTRSMLPGANQSIANPMKAFKGHTPDARYNDRSVLTQFLASQKKLVKLLQLAHSADLSAPRIPISISRWITLKPGDTFRFLIAHQQRHFVQIENTMKALQNLPHPLAQKAMGAYVEQAVSG